MREEKLLQLTAVFLAALVLLLPVSFAQNMSNTTSINQTQDNQTAAPGDFELEASAPSFSKDKYVTIEGTTVPDARLEYFVGPTKVKVSRAKDDGTFKTTRVPLVKKGGNDMLLKVMSEGAFAQTVFTIFYDPEPPVLNLSKIPEFTTQAQLNVKGDVSEPVKIRYTSYFKKDDSAPPAVTGLEIREAKKNSVSMVWDDIGVPDFLEYSVYRNGKRIAVVRSAAFVDNEVASGKEYSYAVSAVDDSCNEGPKSAPKKALTESGGVDEEKESVVELSCTPSYTELDTAMPFDITLNLMGGKNIVVITATDKAGNVAKVEKVVTLDTGPPQFLKTNLEAIGTTYIPEVTIRGNLSEKGTVFVYLNDESKPSTYKLTRDDGSFEIPVKLRSDVKVSTGSATELDTGVGWENKIKLKAVDLAGQEAWYPGAQKSSKIVWALCGYGSWMDFDIETVTPSILTPRLLMEGVQQVGVPFTLKYIGGQEDVDIAGLINAVPVRVSPDLQDAYDNEKIRAPQVWIKKRVNEKNVWDGFVQINFAPWPRDTLDLDKNATESNVEQAISNWRRGEYPDVGAAERGIYLKHGCPNPLFGCVNLYLELDIPLKEKNRIYDAQTQQERFEYKSVRQRNCLPITIDIDQVIPPDVIRKDALKATSNFFSRAIELIDKILDPLTTFTENMVYLCMGTAATLFLMGIYKRFVCSKIYLTKGVDTDIAEAGLCEIAYDNYEDTEDKEQMSKMKGDCSVCWKAIRNYNNIVQDLYQPVCDRISCPSAPTVQKYILDKKGSPKDITNKIPAGKAREKAIKEWGVKGKVYSGSGCGFSDLISLGYTVGKGGTEVAKTPVASASAKSGGTPAGGVVDIDVLSSFATGSAVAGAAPGAGSGSGGGDTVPADAAVSSATICGFKPSDIGTSDGRVGIKELYEIYQGTKNSKIKEKCTSSSLHPACPLCCGIDYMWQWNSACGVGNFLGVTKAVDIDTYDELKQSTKLAAEKVGKGDDIGGGNIFNFLSGFCTSSGNPTPDVVRTGLKFKPAIEEAEENLFQVFVFPSEGKSGDSFKYDVYSGYLAKTYRIENALKDPEKKSTITASQRYSFSSSLEAIKLKDLTQFFSNLGTAGEAAQKAKFTNALCSSVPGKKLYGEKSCEKVAPKIFEQVKGHVGTVDQEYIIKPNSGLFNSIRCICLTAIISYLKKWRAVSVAIKNCIDMIRLTGDGAEGQCRSMLSTYVCDLLWEIISCFVNKWSAPSGARMSAEAGIGDFLGVLTGAGQDVSNEVKGRYGETSMFNAMFNEKELVHGLCLLAFGFEWNVDVNAMVQQSVESMPVETTVMGPAPAQGRFLAWNPAINGLTTWEYHFGLTLVAGSDINARMKLRCSKGFGCSESDGFAGGECDCNKLPAPVEISINPTCKPSWKTRISQDELVSYDCSYVVQGGKYRFDTMIFEYDWEDSSTKQKETKKSESKVAYVGDTPPSFCRFDLFTLSYRCQFGESLSGIRLEKITPQYPDQQVSKTDKTKVFAKDDSLDFELSIKQLMPPAQEDQTQGVKYLGYKIANSAGEVVKELDPNTDPFTEQLKTEGSYRRDMSISPPQGGWEAGFTKGGTAGAGSAISVYTDNTALTNKIKANLDKYIGSVSISYKEDGKSAVPKNSFAIDIDEAGKIGFYLADPKKRDARGFYSITSNLIMKSGDVAEAGKTYSFSYTVPDTKNVYTVSFKLKSKDQFNQAKRIQFVLSYSAGSSSKDPCASDIPIPVTWSATFTAYDADKYGRITDQVSVDPQTGEPQSKTVAFQMVCKNAKDLEVTKEAPPLKEEIVDAFLYYKPTDATIEFPGPVPVGEVQLFVLTQGTGTVTYEETSNKFKGTMIDAGNQELVPEERAVLADIKNQGGAVYFAKLNLKEEDIGKEYNIKVTYKQGDKVIDTRTYKFTLAEAPKGIQSVKLGDNTLVSGKSVPVPVGEHKFVITTTLDVKSVEIKGKAIFGDEEEGFLFGANKTEDGKFESGPLEVRNYRRYEATVTAIKEDTSKDIKTYQFEDEALAPAREKSAEAREKTRKEKCDTFKTVYLSIPIELGVPYDDHTWFKDRKDIEDTCGFKVPETWTMQPTDAICDNIAMQKEGCVGYVTRMKKGAESAKYTEKDIAAACDGNFCRSSDSNFPYSCTYDVDKKECIPKTEKAKTEACVKFKQYLRDFPEMDLDIPYEDHGAFKSRADIQTTCKIIVPEKWIMQPPESICDEIERRFERCEGYTSQMLNDKDKYLEKDIKSACENNFCVGYYGDFPHVCKYVDANHQCIGIDESEPTT